MPIPLSFPLLTLLLYCLLALCTKCVYLFSIYNNKAKWPQKWIRSRRNKVKENPESLWERRCDVLQCDAHCVIIVSEVYVFESHDKPTGHKKERRKISESIVKNSLSRCCKTWKSTHEIFEFLLKFYLLALCKNIRNKQKLFSFAQCARNFAYSTEREMKNLLNGMDPISFY